MVSKKSRSEIRRKKHYRLRNRFAGTAERPRLAVFRSNNHMYAQIIDDSVDEHLAGACDKIWVTLEADGSCTVILIISILTTLSQ